VECITGEVDHGVEAEPAAEGDVAAEELGVGLLQQRRPELIIGVGPGVNVIISKIFTT
jgi:hypothetical protein